MTNYVLDCSFCAALFLPDESSDMVRKNFLNIKEDDKVFVPLLWWYEISNVLIMAVRRNRLQYSDVLDINNLLSSYNFITDTNFGNGYTEILLGHSNNLKLTVYDAAYLELAIRKQGIIATLDNDLKNACIKMGLQIL
jgi:predicted nucleic acid-binding protein